MRSAWGTKITRDSYARYCQFSSFVTVAMIVPYESVIFAAETWRYSFTCFMERRPAVAEFQ